MRPFGNDDAMPIKLLTVAEADALGIPRVTWVIGSVPARKSGKSPPSATSPTKPHPTNPEGAEPPAEAPLKLTPAAQGTLPYVVDGGPDGRMIVEILIAGRDGDPASAQLQAMRNAGYVEEGAQPPKDRPRQAKITGAGRKALKCPAPAI
jgi:hypothetical protein